MNGPLASTRIIHMSGFPSATGVRKAKSHRSAGFDSYQDSYREQAYRMSLLGATNKDLATLFKVSPTTVALWAERITAFGAALSAGRDEADAAVAQSLYQRALGASHPETKVFCNSEGEVTQATITKHYPPDTAAATTWLRLRQPAKWREAPPDEAPMDNMAKVLAALSFQLPG